MLMALEELLWGIFQSVAVQPSRDAWIVAVLGMYIFWCVADAIIWKGGSLFSRMVFSLLTHYLEEVDSNQALNWSNRVALWYS